MKRDSRSSSCEFEELPADVAYDHALDKALKLLGSRSRSRREITSRLRRAGFSSEVVALVEIRLGELDLLNDADFAREMVQGALARGVAPRVIKSQLQAKGISQDLADAAIEESGAAERERQSAADLARRRCRTYGRLDPAVAQRRLAAFLAHKGYGHEVVYWVCREVLGELDID